MGTRFPGGGTYLDPTGYYNDVWYLSTHGFKLFGTAVQTSIDAPFGRPIIPRRTWSRSSATDRRC